MTAFIVLKMHNLPWLHESPCQPGSQPLDSQSPLILSHEVSL
jgi:hypothetical protein